MADLGYKNPLFPLLLKKQSILSGLSFGYCAWHESMKI